MGVHLTNPYIYITALLYFPNLLIAIPKSKSYDCRSFQVMGPLPVWLPILRLFFGPKVSTLERAHLLIVMRWFIGLGFLLIRCDLYRWPSLWPLRSWGVSSRRGTFSSRDCSLLYGDGWCDTIVIETGVFGTINPFFEPRKQQYKDIAFTEFTDPKMKDRKQRLMINKPRLRTQVFFVQHFRDFIWSDNTIYYLYEIVKLISDLFKGVRFISFCLNHSLLLIEAHRSHFYYWISV